MLPEKKRMSPLPRPIFAVLCAAHLAALVWPALAGADDWPQWRGPNRDGVWRETGIVEKFSSTQLTPKWRVEIGSGYCGPTVAAGRVYVMDLITKPVTSERIHCFDEKTGAKLWSHEY